MSNCNCNQEPLPCPDCLVPAFKISMIDSSGNNSSGFTIKLIDKSNTVTIVNDTTPPNYSSYEKSYTIFIKSGTYQIEITKAGYDTIRLNNITVTENRCGINNPRVFTIKPEAVGLKKSKKQQISIIKDTTLPGCGS